MCPRSGKNLYLGAPGPCATGFASDPVSNLGYERRIANFCLTLRSFRADN